MKSNNKYEIKLAFKTSLPSEKEQRIKVCHKVKQHYKKQYPMMVNHESSVATKQ